MITFIVNETSGRGRAAAVWRRLRRSLLAEEVAFRAWSTRQPGEATELARLASQEGCDFQKLVVVGGDGTVNEVVNGISDFEHIALGVVPIGSGNDFVRGLGLPRLPERALRRILASDGSRRIDLGQVTIDAQAPRRFAISGGIGMDAWVCAQVDASSLKTVLNRLGMGSLSYGLMTLTAAWNLDTTSGTALLDTPYGQHTCRLHELIFLACMNFPWEGGGVPIAPGASAEDGCFSVCLADWLTGPQVLAKLPRLALGKHIHTNGVTMLPANRVELLLDAPQYVHADGEVIGKSRRVVFDVLPNKLRVLV